MMPRLQQFMAIPMPRAFVDFVSRREVPYYWLEFDSDPEVRVGDIVIMEVAGMTFGYAKIEQVSRCGHHRKWKVRWEANGFEFAN